MNKWKAIPLLQYSVEFLQMHSCGQRRNGKYVADVKYGVWMAARCCIEAAGEGRGARESATQARHVWPIQRRPNGHPSPSFPVQHRFNAQILPTVGLYRALSRISKAICVSSVLECLSEQYSTTVHSGLGLGGPVSPNSSIPRTILPRFREN